MRVLLDTHVVIWAVQDPAALSLRARAAIEEAETVVSATSVWEIAIKRALGKLRMEIPTAELVDVLQRDVKATLLPMRTEHAVRVESLPPHHRDPFDRILVAQAQVEGLAICTADEVFGRYDVPIVW